MMNVERLQTEMVMAYSEVLSQNTPGRTEKNCEKH
jgi:hypothetical protein